MPPGPFSIWKRLPDSSQAAGVHVCVCLSARRLQLRGNIRLQIRESRVGAQGGTHSSQCDFRGMTQLEIATLLQQPLGTIKTRMRLTLQQLRKAPDAHVPDDSE